MVSNAATAPGVGWGDVVIADLDGDGSQDLSFGTFAAGTVYIFLNAGTLLGGATVDPDVDADVIFSGDGAFGFALGTGDLEGDGLPELYVGRPAHAATRPLDDWSGADGLATGELRVFSALAVLAGATADDTVLRYLGESPGDLFGSVIAPPSALDGGGDDLVISAPRYGGDVGRVYVVSGAP